MIFAAASVIQNIICWKSGAWKEWRLYYPTILFIIIGNLTCDLLLYRKPLWGFTDIIGQHMFLMIGLMLLMYPATVMLYFKYFPQSLYKQILYVLMWAAIYTVVEIVSMLFNIFDHCGGWSILFSFLHNILMFLLLVLHLKKPLLAWPAAFFLAFLIMLAFGIPTAVEG